MSEERQPTILVVDDEPLNIDVLSGILRDQYKVRAAINGEKALRIAASDTPPDLILLDVMMPGLSGFEVCARLKRDVRTSSIPVVFVTAMGDVKDETKGFEVGAIDYITKPVSPPIVKHRVRTHLELLDRQRHLSRLVSERTKELADTRLEIIRRLGRAAEFKDNETGLHVIRMSHYTKILALAVGMNEDEAEMLLHAAPMHDIGKIGIPDRVLRKPGGLDDEEWKIMRRHPEIGAKIIGEHQSPLLEMSRVLALTHHERWDGTGYPNGVEGEAIPVVGRLAAIADVFDALTSDRPYKKAWTVDDAMETLEKDAGTHFDPRLVPPFVAARDEVIAIKEHYSEARAREILGEAIL